MRINLQGAQRLSGSDPGGKPGPTNSATRLSTGSALGEDQAQLSGADVQVRTLAAQVLQFPEVRQEKVDTLRQMVLGGSYQRSSNQVAEAVLVHLLVMPAA